jgi:hypothetical protein
MPDAWCGGRRTPILKLPNPETGSETMWKHAIPGLALCMLAGPAFGQTPYWAAADPPRAHYEIDVEIDPAAGRIGGAETVRFTNTTRWPIHRLALQWLAGGDRELEISVAGTPVPLIGGSGGGRATEPLLLDLPDALPPGAELVVEIEFDSRSFDPGAEKLTLTWWHPRLSWGFRVHDEFDVRIRAPADYAVAATGRLDDESGYYHAEDVRSFGIFLAKDHLVAESFAGDVLVRSIFTSEAEELANILHATAVDVIDWYRQRFGLYPYDNLTIIPGMDRPAGGYPVATGIVAIHGQERMDERPEIHWLWITAHEIGHQYWGEYVLEKDNPAWLWIGMGIYADREYVRARNLSLEKHEGLMSRYTDGVRGNLDTTVDRPPEQLVGLGFSFNNVVIHGKGFSIISALDNLLGDETFDRVYLRCLNEFAGRRLGAAEFRKIAEEESGQDLGWFFDEWVRSNRYLLYEVTSRASARVGDRHVSEVTVERVGPMKMPVPVVAYFEDGTSQVQFTDRLLGVNVLRFESSAPLADVSIDPDGELAVVDPPPGPPEPPTTLEELEAGIRALPWTDVGPEVLSLFEAVKILKPSEPYLYFKLGLALYDAEHYADALEAFRALAALAGEDPGMSFITAVWQGHVLDLLGRRDEAVKAYREALERDTGGTHRHDQYGMVINRAWVERRIEEPFTRR